MSENRNDVPGDPAGETQEQPWTQPSGDTPGAFGDTSGPDAPTQPLYGRYDSAAGAGQPSSPEPGQGPWTQPNQPQQPTVSQGAGQQPNYGAGYGVPPSPYGYPGNYQAPVQQPGKTMGIVGLILSCLFFIPFASLVGVILSIVGFVQSRKAKMSNGPALAGIIIGGVVFVLTLIATIAILVFAVDQVSTLIEICEDRGPGTHFVDGEIYDCSVEDFEQSL
ncbi:hypothetical protein GCM10009688_32850 [Arthrobacter gandavensis]|uniref:DUF4190 domain-containing protein n=1 Tax=Arthrobacter gandavensis TaxID=169960 RepID=A0ABP5AXS5_9MICC|nr:DUF4190 domain-containing protein [Arthrobacter citreus]